MGFRGKLRPIFVNEPDPNIRFPLSPLMDFERANKERQLGKISQEVHTIDLNLTTRSNLISICSIKTALLLERNGSRIYSGQNCLTSHRWILFCHRPLIQSSTTATARLPWQRPSSLLQDSKVFRYTGGFGFFATLLASTTMTKRYIKGCVHFVYTPNFWCSLKYCQAARKGGLFCSWLLWAVKWTPGMLVASTGLLRDNATSRLVNGQVFRWPGELAPRKPKFSDIPLFTAL